MHLTDIAAAVDGLAIGPIRYFDQIDSTNAEAGRWIEMGCPDLALVIADEQTAGKGRAGRIWFTPPGTALAFSLILLPNLPSQESARPILPEILPRITALGALAVSETLQNQYNLATRIKWPNDVLCNGQKCCGILAEAIWQGDQLAGIILGIGINIKPDSVPSSELLTFPATCVEAALGETGATSQTVNRLELLAGVISELLLWRNRIASKEFIVAWEDRLAFHGQWVRVSGHSSTPMIEGQLLGLEADGQLRLCDRNGKVFTISSGELNLRPV